MKLPHEARPQAQTPRTTVLIFNPTTKMIQLLTLPESMKEFAFICGLCITFTGHAMAEKEAGSDAKTPTIKFADPVFNFGKTTGGKVISHKFTFSNEGKGSLKILSIQPSCGCTAVSTPTEETEPGKEGEFSVRLDTTHLSGEIAKTISVTSNDPSDPVVTLEVVGNVETKVSISPNVAILTYPIDDADKQPSTTITVLNLTDKPVKITNARSESKLFRASLKEKEAGKAYELIVEALPPYPSGGIQGDIVFETSIDEIPEMKTSVIVMAQPQFTFSPVTLTLPVKPGGKNEKYRIKAINNSSKKTVITGVTSNNPMVAVKLVETDAGEEYTIEASARDGKELVPNFNTQITIATDSEKNPTILIPVLFEEPKKDAE